MVNEAITRRMFGKLVGKVAAFAGLSQVITSDTRPIESSWPSGEEAIIDEIKECKFEPGSQLRTTIFPRKIMWEMAQVLKREGKWKEGDEESDWLSHPELFDQALAVLAESGVKGGRLVIAPFELTEDGVKYEWQALEEAIKSMKKHGMSIDLAIGPLNTPYYPGVRLPISLENQLEQELLANGKTHITISREKDPNAPDSSDAIKKYSKEFLTQLLDTYGEDERIDKFYFGNEYPDNQAIEGVDVEYQTRGKKYRGLATLSVSEDVTLDLLDIVLERTKKSIAINTNIHPARRTPTGQLELRKKLGPLLDKLGEQSILGFDTYRTEEAKDYFLSGYMNDYGWLMDRVRAEFPLTELVYTELQGSPWPPNDLVGQSWADIYSNHPEIVAEYYEQFFPPTLDSHLIASKITEIGFWGAEVLIVLKMLGYRFPGRLFKTMAETMDQA